MNKQDTCDTSTASPHSTHPRRSSILLQTLTFIRKHVLNYYLGNKTLNIRTSRITLLFCLADNVNLDFRDADIWISDKSSRSIQKANVGNYGIV